MNRCSSCRMPIRWATTNEGRAMPVDPEPAPNGNVKLTEVGGVLMAEVFSVTQVKPEGPLYLSHFVTCPNAKQHRRRR